jgi:hypothetical protein
MCTVVDDVEGKKETKSACFEWLRGNLDGGLLVVAIDKEIESVLREDSTLLCQT